MPAPHRTDPRSPFPGGRPALYVVGSKDDPANGSPVALRPSPPGRLEGPTDQTEIADAATPILVDRRPLLIRMLTKVIVGIRWFPIAWSLLCSIPSEARQAWHKAFGPKEE